MGPNGSNTDFGKMVEIVDIMINAVIVSSDFDRIKRTVIKWYTIRINKWDQMVQIQNLKKWWAKW